MSCWLVVRRGRPQRQFRTGLCFTADVYLSPSVLGGHSTHRRETLPHDQKLANFIMQVQKFGRPPPNKKVGAKNMQNFGRFLQLPTLVANITGRLMISKIGKLMFPDRFLLRSSKRAGKLWSTNYGDILNVSLDFCAFRLN